MANTSKSIQWSFYHVASKVFYFANTIPVKPLGDAIPTYSSRAIWDASFKGFCQEASPEVIRYYRKRDCPPRASTPGKLLCDLFSALLFVVDPCGIFMVIVSISWVERLVGSSVELCCSARAPCPLVVPEALDRPHIHCYVSHEGALIVVSKSICARRGS